MRVFLDTNVLVASLVARGLCSELLELVVHDHELLTCRPVLSELERELLAARQQRLGPERAGTRGRCLPHALAKSCLQRTGAGPAVLADVELYAVRPEVLYLEELVGLGRGGQSFRAHLGELGSGGLDILDEETEVVQPRGDFTPCGLGVGQQHGNVDVAVR